PPEINPELKDQLVTYNSPLEFKCSLGGVPTPEIRWTKDGLNISNNNILRIHQARLEDSGKYTCRANNSEGSKNSTFWIEVAGTIITPPISRYVTEGDRVDLICIASGFPKPTLVWTFNNGNLPSGINQFNREGESN
ncbi:unnamed protein product, partial [Pocillopora meandrina]